MGMWQSNCQPGGDTLMADNAGWMMVGYGEQCYSDMAELWSVILWHLCSLWRRQCASQSSWGLVVDQVHTFPNCLASESLTLAGLLLFMHGVTVSTVTKHCQGSGASNWKACSWIAQTMPGEILQVPLKCSIQPNVRLSCTLVIPLIQLY